MVEKEEINNDLRSLEGGKLYGFSSGVLGQIVAVNLVNSYIFIFYVYAVGLNALLVSIGTAIAAMINAFGNIFFGYIVDKKDVGKFGKRRPFLLYALPLVVISLVLMWTTPVTSTFGENNWGIALYLWFFLSVFFLFYALLRATYMSMIPEQSQVETNRIKIGSLVGMFSILGTVLGIFIPLILQAQLQNPDDIFNTPGDRQFLLGILPFVGILAAVVAIGFTLLAFFSTNEDFLQGKKNNTEKQKESFKNVIKKIFNPFRDKNYKYFLYCILLSSVGVRILVKNIPLFLTFVLYLREGAFLTFLLPLIVFAILGFVFWSKRAQTKGVKKTFIQSTWMIFISLVSTGFLIIDMPAAMLQWLARLIIALVLFSLVVGYIIPAPAISQLVDEAPEELKNQTNSESLSGSYFGAQLFIINLAGAIGDLLIGAILMGENAESRIAIGLLFPIAGFCYFLSILALKKVKMN